MNRIKRNKDKPVPFKSFITLCTKWLGRKVLGLSSQDLNLALRVLEKIHRVYDTRGLTECIRYTKEIRLTFQKLIFNISPDWEVCDRITVPKILRPVYSRILEQRSYALIRLTLSVLFSTRLHRAEVSPSFKTIEDGPSYKYENATFLRDEMKKFLKINGTNMTQLGKKPKKLNFSEFHMTSKSGPNGHALWTSFLDYRGLSQRQLECISIIAGDKLSNLASRFNRLTEMTPDFFFGVGNLRKETNLTRRLICIQDKETKTREVAVLDYWSQSALLPLHRYEQKFLSRIDQDCTMKQEKNFYYLRAKDDNHYWSIDLTAATDRMPILVQHQFLSVWFGPEYADAWRELMVGTPFSFQGRDISYSVGNPMGAYSSFNTFAICHHFFVYLACNASGVNWKRCPYMLLGDDIVIAHDGVAKEYLKILDAWGVNVSLQKTHKSKYAFEFAKQTRLHMENVSQFPFSALYDRRSETFTTSGIIANEVWNKKWNVDIMSCLKGYFLEVLKWPRPRFRAFAPTLELSIDILGFLKGRRSLGKGLIRYVSSKVGLEFQMNSWDLELYSKFLLLHLIHKTFLESRDRVISAENKKPLGLLAEQMVILITSLDEDEMGEAFSNIEAVPFLQIYGRAEETWLNLRTDLSIYQLGESERHFRNMFQKINIPGSDNDFHTRHRDIVMVQAARAAKQLEGMIFSIPRVKDDRVDLDITVPWSNYIKNDRSSEYLIPKV